MHPQGVDEHEHQHHPVTRGQPAHDDKAHQHQPLGHHRHPQVAQKAQGGHQHHAQDAGALPGNLDEPPLNRVDVKDLVEVVGQYVVAQAVGQSGEGQHRQEHFYGPLSLLFGHVLYALSFMVP